MSHHQPGGLIQARFPLQRIVVQDPGVVRQLIQSDFGTAQLSSGFALKGHACACAAALVTLVWRRFCARVQYFHTQRIRLQTSNAWANVHGQWPVFMSDVATAFRSWSQ